MVTSTGVPLRYPTYPTAITFSTCTHSVYPLLSPRGRTPVASYTSHSWTLCLVHEGKGKVINGFVFPWSRIPMDNEPIAICTGQGITEDLTRGTERESSSPPALAATALLQTACVPHRSMALTGVGHAQLTALALSLVSKCRALGLDVCMVRQTDRWLCQQRIRKTGRNSLTGDCRSLKRNKRGS